MTTQEVGDIVAISSLEWIPRTLVGEGPLHLLAGSGGRRSHKSHGMTRD